MPRLLISVRSVAEASQAMRGGADVIDIKEPRRGALGAADTSVWRGVIASIGGQRPVSGAIGELHESQVLMRAQQTHGLDFAKVGLAGMLPESDWPRRWQAVQHALTSGTHLVAVIYADWQKAAAPLPCDILNECARMGCRWALVDTWHKANGRLFDCMDDDALRDIVALARRLEMQVVLAGSLTLSDLSRACAQAPDYVGIRGAACNGGRDGRIAEGLVRQLSSGLRADFYQRT